MAEFSLTTLTVEDFPEFAEVADRSSATAEGEWLGDLRALRHLKRSTLRNESGTKCGSSRCHVLSFRRRHEGWVPAAEVSGKVVIQHLASRQW
jgi:hypothetical protein